MESELAGLQRRVAELEAALANAPTKAARPDFRRWVALAPAICGGIVILCVGILLGGSRAQGAGDAVLVCAVKGGQLRLPAKPSCEPGEQAVYLGGSAGPSGTAQGGPSKVVEPFVVVDKAGRELFKVTTASGNGVATVYGSTGSAQVILGSPIGSGKPQIQVLSSDGRLKTGIGINTEGRGVIALKGGQGETSLWLTGQGLLQALNEQGKKVVALGVNDSDIGMHLYDKEGKELVTIGTPPAGSNLAPIRVLGPDGSLRAGLGMGEPNGDGLLVLKGGGAKTAVVLAGNGVLDLYNAQGKVVAKLGVSGFGGGDFHLYNSSGTAVVGILSTANNFGIVQLYNSGGQERVTLGTLTNGKGDVCASGDQGSNCLSRLNPKY